jgi:hypothetical protein
LATWRREKEMGNIKRGFRKIGFEDGSWVKLAQDHVQWQWRALFSAVLNLQLRMN